MSVEGKKIDSQNLKDEEIIRTEKPLEVDDNNDKQNELENVEKGKEIIYKETPYRWFFLVAYCLSVISNQMQWVCFSSIATDFAKNYDKPLWKVNMFTLIYMILYPCGCFPEAWIIDDYSIRLGLMLAAGGNIIGAGLKLLVNKDKSLACCYIGQVFASLFQPALLNSPGKIAADWFREDIRTVICSICCLSVIIGALVGFLWNLMFIKEDATQDEFKDQVFYYLLSEFILTVVFSAPTFFIIKDKPDIPPSPSQDEDKKKIPGFKESFKLLFTNIRFIYLFISYLLVVGFFDTIATIINSLLELYDISGQQSSVIYAVSSIAGMIASLLISWLLDKYKKFRLFLLILSISAAVFQGLFTLLLELIDSKGLNGYAIGLVVYSIINMCVTSFFTIGMNYACEITYPVGESFNGSIMASMPQVAAIGVSFLCDHFISHVQDKRWISNVILLCFLTLSIFFVFLLDDRLDREEIEKAGRIKENEKKTSPQVETLNAEVKVDN